MTNNYTSIQTQAMDTNDSSTCSTTCSRDMCLEQPALSEPRYVSFMSRNLNNEACHAISNGEYDFAISNLKKALQLTRGLLCDQDENETQCGCEHCRLDSYVSISDEENDECSCEIINNESKSTQAKIQSFECIPSCPGRKRSRNSNCQETTQDKVPIKNSNDEGFIYCRPLLVPQHSVDFCRHMGSTLSFIILFNIALTHHLKAIEIASLLDKNDERRMAILEQPLKLYELVYQLQFQCSEGQRQLRLTNLRLMMLVTNNISEIHKLAGNTEKHTQCLEHLLNAFMYMNHNFSGDKVLTNDETNGIFDTLAPVLKSDVYAAAA